MTRPVWLRSLLVAVIVGTASGCTPGGPPLCGPPEFSITGPQATDSAIGTVDDDGTPLALPSNCDPPPPPPDCEGCGGSHGDPHLTTFDQRRYDVHAAGELTAAVVDDIEVQLRMEPAGTSVAVTTAVAVRVGQDRFTITPEDGDWVARHDGRAVTLRPDLAIPLGDGSVALDETGDVVAAWPDGFLVHVHLHNGYSGVDVRLPDAHGPVQGLFGDADGNPDNDLVTRDGRPVEDPGDFEEFQGVYVESWRVTDESSLFDYAPGESTATWTDREFPRQRITIDDLTAAQRAEAEAICRDAGITDPGILDDCILDVALTGDASYAEAHARRQQAFLPDGPAADDDQGDDGGTDGEGGTDGGGEDGGTDGGGDGGEADGGEDPADPTGDRSELVEWLVELPDLEATEPGMVREAGHVLVHTWDPEAATGVLVALDQDTGDEAWRRPGLTRACPVALTGDGRVVVQGAPDGPLGIDELSTSTIAVLDAATGEVLGTPAAPDEDAGEPRLDGCRYGLTVTDGVAVVDGRSGLHGFDVSGDQPRHLWAREHRGVGTTRVATPVGDGSRVVFGEHPPEGAYLVLLDVATGRELDRLDVPTRIFSSPTLMLAVGDDLVISLDADQQDEDVITTVLGISTAGDRLDDQWRLQGRQSDEDTVFTRRMTDGAVLGDLLVGHVGQTLVTLDPADGDIVWTYRLSTFRNVSAPPAIDTDGNVYDGTFGGPWVVSVDREGQERWSYTRDQLVPTAGVGDVKAFGPVVDDVLYVRSSGQEGPVVAGVRTEP